MRLKVPVYIGLLLLSTSLFGRTLHVGTDQTFSRLQDAAKEALPGDTILLHAGIYSGGDFIENLQGTANDWITIAAQQDAEVIFHGGGQAFHLLDPAFVRIEGLIFEEQTGNGVNIDDAGTFDTPAHDIVIRNCTWRSMNATGNNDELKLSGLDHFTIINCRFANGSDGGSLVDMVGCHNGIFEANTFENAGSNCIQAKGGTRDVIIRHNLFRHGGQRAVNIGGSTDLQYFRPQGVNYEASLVRVLANIFIGATAPVAYVGAVNCEVSNNTIILPERWAVRILQETTEPGFLPCGNNGFVNNIVVFTSAQPAFNIGPNTAAETFTLSNNLWFNPDNAIWSGPNTPSLDSNSLLNEDPLFSDTLYHLQPGSPAIGKGRTLLQPIDDFEGKQYKEPRSIGAMEATSASVAISRNRNVILLPNPVGDDLVIHCPDARLKKVQIVDSRGLVLIQAMAGSEEHINLRSLISGAYWVKIEDASYLLIKK